MTRTTRRVALTGAGAELLGRAQAIVERRVLGAAAVRRVANGEVGTVRLGIVPNVEPVLAPHVVDALLGTLPTSGRSPTDVAAGLAAGRSRRRGRRRHHLRLASSIHPASSVKCFAVNAFWWGCDRAIASPTARASIWTELAGDTWAFPVRHCSRTGPGATRVLENAGIFPPTVELETTDVGATGWTRQAGVEWVMTGAALSGRQRWRRHGDTVEPAGVFAYKLQWNPARTQTAAAARFVQLSLTVDVPPGWTTQPGHLRFDGAALATMTEPM